jgi:hypothetical protein
MIVSSFEWQLVVNALSWMMQVVRSMGKLDQLSQHPLRSKNLL